MKQIFEDALPHFMPKWTRNVLRELEDPDIQALPSRTAGQKHEVATQVTDSIMERTQSNQRSLDYGQHGSCLVGEANMFTDDYDEGADYDKRCDRCSTLAGHQAFMATISKTNLFSFKNNLYKHFKEEHPELHQKWEAKK